MVPDSTRQLVRRRGQFRCEYCHSPEAISPDRFTLDHTQPRSKGGTDDQHNLALACHRCNERRSNATTGLDPETATIVDLFNPRQQHWCEHFSWTPDGTEILGQTAIGRATCERLDLNDRRYPLEDSIRKVRQIWVKAGWHPPLEDPIQSQ
jgi:hypothetical protein